MGNDRTLRVARYSLTANISCFVQERKPEISEGAEGPKAEFSFTGNRGPTYIETLAFTQPQADDDEKENEDAPYETWNLLKELHSSLLFPNAVASTLPTTASFIETLLGRSQKLPLRLIVTRRSQIAFKDDSAQERVRVKDILNVVTPHIQRCEALCFDVTHTSSLPRILTDFPHSAPHLTRLTLKSALPAYFKGLVDDSATTKAFQFPKLRNLALDGWELPRPLPARQMVARHIRIAQQMPSPHPLHISHYRTHSRRARFFIFTPPSPLLLLLRSFTTPHTRGPRLRRHQPQERTRTRHQGGIFQRRLGATPPTHLTLSRLYPGRVLADTSWSTPPSTNLHARALLPRRIRGSPGAPWGGRSMAVGSPPELAPGLAGSEAKTDGPGVPGV
ncbi:hypothetical protein D9615_006844 [Tricholomella constricta]|uniref:Uncharacterized protein n=1 Tax=Tricholomella constricta TaxID=117010 RepID=A0A8H5H8X7_9AGAR|nr:hypothetical protein D9615_006844 [Tricholomella constricta]